MKKRTTFVVAAGAHCLFATAPPLRAAFTLQDIAFWTGTPDGPDVNEAVLVVDWSDGSTPLAWGYRWPAAEPRTGRDLLAAVVAADARLSVGGLASGFVSHFAWDADRDGTADLFHPDYDAATSRFWSYFVNNDVHEDPVDFTKNSHIVPPATSVVPLGNPYAETTWTASVTGVLDRPLADGSWDGFHWVATPVGPGEPVAAPLIPEPATISLLLLSATGFLRRRVR